MTTDQDFVADIDEELADFMNEQVGLGNVDFRADVPKGTVLGAVQLDNSGRQSPDGGNTIQITKGDSMVRARGQSLPERTVVYDTRTGMISRVPTAQLRYQLSKRRADGSRVYSRRPPVGIVMPEPIDDTCRICLKARNGVKRNFYTEDDLLIHYQRFHELEWQGMERQREMDQRREDANRMERLILMLAQALRPDIASRLDPEVREQIEHLQTLMPSEEVADTQAPARPRGRPRTA